MRLPFDIGYLLAALVTAPLWLTRLVRTGKIRTDWPARFGKAAPEPGVASGRVFSSMPFPSERSTPSVTSSRVWRTGRRRPTSSSRARRIRAARARALFGDDHLVVRYPFDVSWAVRRFLDRIAPDVVALVELEVWPTFVATCRQRDVPVCVINGRLTERSLRRYSWVGGLVRPSFVRLAFAAVQTAAYAERFRQLGADPVHVTGTMKWDAALIAEDVPEAGALAEAMGIDRDRPLVVAGSTAPEEHALLRDAVPPGVQLLCAPRRPEWFDEAAEVLAGCARRSGGDCGSATDRFLLDTIGDLGKAYALADVVVIGRSFGARHGSDFMEPVSLGKPTIVGPAMADFAGSVEAMRAESALVEVSRESLAPALAELLADKERCQDLAERGRRVIRAQQGATERHVELILGLLG